MNQKNLLSILLIFIAGAAPAQAQQTAFSQYFDGADTNKYNSILVQLDTGSGNVWQVGPPQKTLFDSAATAPNAIVTDTINTYPNDKSSAFQFGLRRYSLRGNIVAFRWMQKLDMDFGHDGGAVEYSLDTGQTWISIFTDTNVYNFYGFDTTNADTLANGTHVFTGTDSVWRDVWLCYRNSYFLQHGDSIIFRFTFYSDNVDSNKDGWMIDNMLIQETIFHTVNKTDPGKTLLVYPTITTGIVKVSLGDEKGYIDNMVLVNEQGQIVKRISVKGTKADFDIGGMPAGNYFLSVHTDKNIEIHRVVLSP